MTEKEFLSGKPFRNAADPSDAPWWEVKSVIEPQRRVVQMVEDTRKGMHITEIRSDGYVQVVPFLTSDIKWLYLPDLITQAVTNTPPLPVPPPPPPKQYVFELPADCTWWPPKTNRFREIVQIKVDGEVFDAPFGVVSIIDMAFHQKADWQKIAANWQKAADFNTAHFMKMKNGWDNLTERFGILKLALQSIAYGQFRADGTEIEQIRDLAKAVLAKEQRLEDQFEESQSNPAEEQL